MVSITLWGGSYTVIWRQVRMFNWLGSNPVTAARDFQYRLNTFFKYLFPRLSEMTQTLKRPCEQKYLGIIERHGQWLVAQLNLLREQSFVIVALLASSSLYRCTHLWLWMKLPKATISPSSCLKRLRLLPVWLYRENKTAHIRADNPPEVRI